MKALIDGDILRYEIGFAGEVGWKAITEREEVPPFDYVKDLLEQRIASILHFTGANDYTLYLSEGKNFRHDIAVTKPYKGQRIPNKPWHFDNLTAYMQGMLNTETVKGIEADDAMAIAHRENTIICSRDKDLRQIPGWFFSWELGKQSSFGPLEITNPGTLTLTQSGGKQVIKGTGYAFFCSQLLTGDIVDNIPGCPGVGPVRAYEALQPILEQEHADYICKSLIDTVESIYDDMYLDEADYKMEEQAKLLWIVRRFNPDGSPQLWNREIYS